MALTMVVGLMVTPAAATDGVSGAVQDFFEWSVNAQRATGDAFWRAIYGDSWNPDGGFSGGVGADRTELVEKYGAYTDTMQTDLQTSTFAGGETVRYFMECTTLDTTYSGAYPTSYIVINSWQYDEPWMFCNFWAKTSSYVFRSVWTSTVKAPAAGDVQGYFNYILPSGVELTTELDFLTGSITAGQYMHALVPHKNSSSSTVGIKVLESAYDQNLSGSFTCYVDFTPLAGLSSMTSLDIAEPSRAGSIAGDVYVVNENGEETVYNDYSVVNETTNIYNDPISGTERPMENWAYDYIERQYNITLEDGANVTIKYGDENIEIVEGDSIETLNYGSGSSGEGGGEGGGGGTGIGDAIANLFTVLGEIILGLITALINLATKALDSLKGLTDLFGQLVETITGFFGGFTDFLAGVFPFLPEETFTIFNFGLILLVAATVFRKFLK